VKSRIYDHLQHPPSYTPDEKKDALEAFLDPVSMMGLNLLKDELTKKLQEK
jgi:hypothetical protein